MLPFVGSALYVGGRFSLAVGRSSVTALQYTAKQTTLKGILRQAGQGVVNQFPRLAQEISPQVMKGLGINFVRGIAPGFELLLSGSKMGISALKNAVNLIQEKSTAMAQLLHQLESLSKNSANLLSTIPRNFEPKIFYSSMHKKELKVVNIGMRNGQPLWVQVNSLTETPFGRKFILNANSNLELAPTPLRQRFNRLQQEDLGGKGAKNVAGKWETESVATAQVLLEPKSSRTLLERERLQAVHHQPIHENNMLPGADPVVYNSILVTRNSEGFPAFQVEINGFLFNINYDAVKNAFFTVKWHPINRKMQNTFYIPSAYAAGSSTALKSNAHSFVKLTDLSRSVTDAERTATIKALGTDIEFPFRLPEIIDSSPILKQIISIWTGDKVILTS